MDMKDLVPIYAAVLSTVVFSWQVFTWWATGPRLRGKTAANVQIIAGGKRDDIVYVTLNVANVGTQPTTVTNVLVYCYKNRWARLRDRRMRQGLVTSGAPAHPVPSVLEVGKTFLALVQQTPDFEEWTRTMLTYIVIVHSFSRRNLLIRVPPIARTPAAAVNGEGKA
jgi:hypothetical protein